MLGIIAMEAEEWRNVIGYDNYMVSNMGRVRNNKGLVLKPGINSKSGYYYVMLSNKGKKKNMKVHILVATAFIPNPDNFPEVNHKDCNRLNCCIDNLEWMTQLENNQSKNKSGNIGYITKTGSGYQASITLYKIKYSYYNKDKKKVEEWLEERREEIKNNKLDTLQAFKVNVRDKKVKFDYPENMEKGIFPTNNGRYKVEKKVCGKIYSKWFDTYNESIEYLNELKELKIKMDNDKKLKVEKQMEETKNKNEIKKTETKKQIEEKKLAELPNRKFGCVVEDRGYYKAKFSLKGIPYTFDSKDRDKCQEWLHKCRLRVINQEDFSDLIIKKEYTYRENKEGRGCVIYDKRRNSYKVEIKFGERRLSKSFTDKEKAEELRLKLSKFETYDEARQYRDNL